MPCSILLIARTGTVPRIKIATEKRLKRQGRARQDVLNLVDAERAAAAKAAKEAEARSSGNVIAGSKEAEGMPDDTDLDEEAEEDFKAWSERELKRLQRSARERLRAERDEAEKKRRRQMTEEEKTAEDEALIKAGLKVDAHTKEKTNMKFMQTYRHKGAFFQDKDEVGLFFPLLARSCATHTFAATVLYRTNCKLRINRPRLPLCHTQPATYCTAPKARGRRRPAAQRQRGGDGE